MNLVILSYQDIYAANGSAKFVKQFERMKTFISNDIDVQIYSNGNKNTQLQTNQESKKLKQTIQAFLGKTFLGSLLAVYIRYNRNAKTVIKRLKQKQNLLDSENTVYLFNDIFVLYYFDKYIGTQNKRCMLVLHNDGNIFKMLGINYPRCKNLFSNLEDKKVLQKQMDKLQKIIFVCDKAKENFVNRYPDLQPKTQTIYIGGEIQPTSPIQQESLKMVTVGSVNGRKNQFGIIQAMQKIKDKSIQLTVVGNGSDLQKCKSFVEQNNMGSQVHFVGEQKDIFPYLKQANLFVMFSHDEGLPISAQEAMSCGLPLLLTDVGGCGELIDENGMLIPVDNHALIEAINYFNSNKSVLDKMGKQSKRIYDETFSLNRMFQQYSDLIKFN